MNVKIELPIHEESQEYLENVFSTYSQIDTLPESINERCVIHMYPYEDTNDGSQGGLGYCDAFNCELHIYDCGNKTVYRTVRHDQIDIEVPCKVRVFKDLSTMLIIDKPVKLSNGQSFLVWKV